MVELDDKPLLLNTECSGQGSRTCIHPTLQTQSKMEKEPPQGYHIVGEKGTESDGEDDG